MNSYPQLQQQLKHLVKTITQCNFINKEDKDDIIQDTFVKIVQKMNDGTLSDDFNEIKGYTFITIRNFCLRHKEKGDRMSFVSILDEILPEEEESPLDEELYVKKIQRIRELIPISELKDIHIKIIELILTNHSHKEIRDLLKINNSIQYSALISTLKNELKRKHLGRKRQKRYGKQKQ